MTIPPGPKPSRSFHLFCVPLENIAGVKIVISAQKQAMNALQL